MILLALLALLAILLPIYWCLCTYDGRIWLGQWLIEADRRYFFHHAAWWGLWIYLSYFAATRG